METEKTMKMNNGLEIPSVGFGVYLITDPDECESCVKTALQDGYRHIDTANAYRNERAVGRGVKDSGLRRDELFITTKLWPSEYGYEKAKRAIASTLARLDTPYVDLLLLHQQYGDYLGAWKAMEEAVAEGKVRSLGISNFNEKRLQNLIDHASILPAVAQMECHPYFQERDFRAFIKPYGLILESWYPLGHGDSRLLEDPLLQRLSGKHRKSVVQIILRWHLQEGFIALPKSTHPEHIKSNLDIFDFALTAAEMAQIEGLDRNQRYFTMSEDEQEKRFLSSNPDFDDQK